MWKSFAVAPRCLVSLLVAALAGPAAWAMEKPSKAEVEAYRRAGSLEERRQRAYEIGNHRVKPGLAASAAYRLQLDQWQKGRLSEHPTPPPGWQGMPTKGNVKIFALLIAFSDYAPSNTAASIDGKLFADGSAAPPYESVRNYYRRASYNQLEIGGATLGWYTTTYPRSSVAQTRAGREALIKEALSSLDAGHDFSQYDNNGDGAIDYFVVIWTGPDNGWANFWWGYQTSFGDSSYLLDGKRLGDYSWQWETRTTGGTFSPLVVIHETGHALGLPDYYDYDDSVGPRGGVGGLDMMDGNWGDHNCFSKFLLDWMTPTVVSGGDNSLSLRSAGSFGDAVLFAKGATSQAFAEYFMVQNRTRTGNDSDDPADGLLVWHLDARLDGTGYDYQYDNSYTAHKLLRLMEADGLEEIEKNYWANAGDYYVTGKAIGPATLPSIARYDNLPNPMLLHDISAAGSPMTVHVDEIVDATPPTGAPSTPTDEGTTKAADSLVFSWTLGTAADPESAIAGYQLQIGTTPGGSDAFDGPVGSALTWTLRGALDGATYYARVRAVNGTGLTTAWSGTSDGITVDLPAFACTAVDNCGLVFKTAGDAAWLEQNAVFYYGATAAQAGDVGDSQSSYLQTTLIGPGALTFWWRTSSESGWDYLHFLVDGTDALTPISGETAWAQRTVSIPAGTHVAQWRYTKDTSVSTGSDTGWVDAVSWTVKTAFYTVAPCRVLDSRQAAGPWGGTPLAASQARNVTLGGSCGIPATAKAVSVNVTVVDATADGHLTVFPAGAPMPTASTVNFRTGQTRANNAIVRLGTAAAATVSSGQPTGTVHVVVDVTGWFE
jgi:M6 family metalloprotease-like protein